MTLVQIANRAQEEERLAILEEEARQAKLAQQQNGISSEQRAKINQIVEEVYGEPCFFLYNRILLGC